MALVFLSSFITGRATEGNKGGGGGLYRCITSWLGGRVVAVLRVGPTGGFGWPEVDEKISRGCGRVEFSTPLQNFSRGS